jgi:hypothetical protein
MIRLHAAVFADVSRIFAEFGHFPHFPQFHERTHVLPVSFCFLAEKSWFFLAHAFFLPHFSSA